MSRQIESKIAMLSMLVREVKADNLNIRDCIDMHQFCAFWGAFDILNYFNDVVILVHGPSGCLGNRRFLPTMGHLGECDNKPHLSTSFTNREVVFGGEKKLVDSLNEVNSQYNPKVIAVLTNCCADIIGDDVEGCIEGLPVELREKIIYLNSGGYSGKSYRRGTEMAFKLLSKHLHSNIHTIDVNSEEKSVNLFLRRWIWDQTKQEEIHEIKRMFQMIGVRLNKIFNQGLSIQDFYEIQNAQLNVALCLFFGMGLFDELNNKFRIPYSKVTYPMGLFATKKWLDEISRILQLDVNIEELEEVKELEEQRRELVNELGKGRKCIIWTQTGERMLALVKLAYELEMEPIVVGVEPSIVRDKLPIFEKEILEDGLDVKVFISKYIEDVNELIEYLGNPVIFCNNNYFPDQTVFKYRFAQNPVYGFNGTRKIYQEMFNVLKKKSNKYSLFVEG
ncbi:UNVERIFIED_CONTAM: nitrogenase molybdenum-cofactor synthesis protein NifE [Acetivibrio alkalicellulosi]